LTARHTIAALLVCAAAGLVPAAAHAQEWAASAVAGRTVNDPLAARVAATNASLELRYSGRDLLRWGYASGGAPVGSPGPAWGSAGAGGQLASWDVRRGTLALTASGDAYGYAAADGVPGGAGATAQLAPTLLLGGGPVRAELRTGALGVLERLGDSTSWRLMSDNGARVIGTRGPLELSADVRYLRAAEAGYAWTGAGATLTRARATAWAFAGRWVSGGFPPPASGYGVGATLRLGRGVEVGASWGQDATDPVYFTAARRTWSAQVTRRFGGRPAPSIATLPVLSAAPDARVEVAVPAAGAGESPWLVGDFTGWQPVALTRDGDRWTVRLPIAPGTYHYALRAPDGRLFVPASLPQVDDGMGGTSAVLVVR
jgi:hypothetical protein